MMRFFCFLLIVFFLNALNGYSQQVSPVLRNFTIRDGLPSNEAYSIYQDKKGFIWICTDAGLVKYDANTFKTFNSTHGLPDNTVFEVKEDKLGRLWFRTFTGYVGYIVNDSIHTIEASKAIINFQEDGIICSFGFDEKNNLYIGHQVLGHPSFLSIAPPYRNKDVTRIFVDTTTNVWLNIIMLSVDNFIYSERRGTEYNGTHTINFYDKKIHLLLRDTANLKYATSSLTRLFAKDNTMTLANELLLKQFDLTKKIVTTNYAKEDIINVYITKRKEILVSHRNKGLFQLDSSYKQSVHPNILANCSNSSILEDNHNGVWYATLNNGIYYSNNSSFEMIDVSSKDYKIIYFMKPFGQKNFLVGIEAGGTYVYGLTDGRVKLLGDIDKNGTVERNGVPRSFKELDSNSQLVSYSKGTHLYGGNPRQIEKFEGSKIKKMPFTELFYYKTNILGYSYTSAIIFDTTDFNIVQQSTTKDRFTAFAYNPFNGEAYFGAMHGLYKYYGQKVIEEKDKVDGFRIKDLEFLNNRLYIATKGYGLVVKSGNSADTIDVKKGLLSNVCEKIFIHGNDCWVSSNLGLCCIKYYGSNYYDVISYPIKDLGTPSLIQDFFVDGDFLYFASGASIYKYPLLEPEEEQTPFYLYSIYLNNQLGKLSEFQILPYNQSKVRIDFGALYYNFSGKVKYRYKLLANEPHWTYTEENSITFPSLSPGNYTLILQAQKGNGRWITCKDVLSFAIEKPYWQRIWFILLIAFVGAMIVFYATYYFYKAKLEKELTNSRIRARFYNLEIKAMKAQMNPHFIFNSLNSIQQFILLDESENALKYLSKFSKLVRKILESNVTEHLSIESEVDILTKYLEIESLRFKSVFNYKIEYEEGLNTDLKIPHMMIQPFVENAIWHGLLPKEGNKNLIIKFSAESNSCIKCIIEDNGVGLNTITLGNANQIKNKSLALEFIKERLSLFTNTLGQSYYYKLENKKDINVQETGVRVEILLPVLED